MNNFRITKVTFSYLCLALSPPTFGCISAAIWFPFGRTNSGSGWSISYQVFNQMEIPYRCEIYFHIYAKLFTQRSKRGGEAGKKQWERYEVGVAGEIGQMRWFSRLHDARTTSAAWPVKIITLKLILFMRMYVYYVCVCNACLYYVCVFVHLLYLHENVQCNYC